MLRLVTQLETGDNCLSEHLRLREHWHVSRRDLDHLRLGKPRTHLLHLRRDGAVVFCKDIAAGHLIVSHVWALSIPFFHQRLTLHKRFAVLFRNCRIDVEEELVIHVFHQGLTILCRKCQSLHTFSDKSRQTYPRLPVCRGMCSSNG